jgi:DNA-binding Xre family transcriptional regulator
MTSTKAKATPFQANTLAKIYLEGKPAEIAEETIAQLCDWLMDELHQLPLNLQFENRHRV